VSPPQGWRALGRFRYEERTTPTRQALHLAAAAPFFDEEGALELLVGVATQVCDVSLRILDFCCTNFAKKTGVVLVSRAADGRRAVHLFSLYKDWLRHFRRRSFDPFRRRERILFEHPQRPGEALETTVAQLNFLRWARAYGVVDFARGNLAKIEVDMNAVLGRGKRAAAAPPEAAAEAKRGRVELSRAPPSKCVVYGVRQDVAFRA
jgi:hypothetical protein